jgi:dephospho-CoA kinase
VLDAIKLIENGLTRLVDSVWVVICDPGVQRRRLTELRNMAPTDAAARIAAQPPQEEKVTHADVVIDNSGSLEVTRAQVLDAWQATAGATPAALSHDGRDSPG